MAKKTAGVLGLDLLLNPKNLKNLIIGGDSKPSMVVLVGDDQFVNRLILSRLRKCIHPDEDDTSWACREFSGDDQPDPRDILDEVATVPMFSDAARIAIVRQADSFVSAHREILERVASQKPGPDGFLILEMRSFPSNTRLAKAVHQHGLAITTSTPPRFDLTKWLRQWASQAHSIDLPAATAGTILERLGNELGQIDQALTTFASALPQKETGHFRQKWLIHSRVWGTNEPSGKWLTQRRQVERLKPSRSLTSFCNLVKALLD